MKKQSFRDRMHEHEGMDHRMHLKGEHMRHGERLHHESAMHKGMYRNEVDEPKVPMGGHQERGMGCEEMKGQAAPIAYGQAGKEGVASDYKKIDSQMKHYHWESADNY